MIRSYFIRNTQYQVVKHVLIMTDQSFYVTSALLQLGFNYKIIAIILLFL